MKNTGHFRGIYRIYPNFIKENWRISTCDQLDLQTLGSQPIMSKNLPDHWLRVESTSFLLDTTHNTSPNPHLQKVSPCRHPCHSWDLGLGTPCKVLSPNFHALNGWDCMDEPYVTWDFGLKTSCEQALNALLEANGSRTTTRLHELSRTISHVKFNKNKL